MFKGLGVHVWNEYGTNLMSRQDDFLDILYQLGTKLLVLDNRACLMRMSDVMSPEAWEPAIDFTKRARDQADCTVMLLVHAARSGQAAFGSSSQEWLVDGNFGITEADNKQRHFVNSKERLGPKQATCHFTWPIKKEELQVIPGKDPALEYEESANRAEKSRNCSTILCGTQEVCGTTYARIAVSVRGRCGSVRPVAGY